MMKRLGAFVLAGMAVLVLAACGTVSTPTIDGTVLTLANAPVVGATVTIGTTSTTTDANGAFSIAGVTPPYDVTVSSTSGNWAHVFVGLSSTTPTLSPVGALVGGPPATSTATIGGTIATGVPIDATHPVEVCVEGVTEAVGGCATVSSGTSYNVTARWLSTANVSVKVHALQMTVPSAGALPTSYHGYYASASTTLVPSNSYTNDVTLIGAVSSTALSGTVTADASITSGQYLVMVQVAPNLLMPLGSAALTGATTPYTALVPTLTGATYTLYGSGSTSASGISLSWRVDLTAGAGRDLTIAGVPTPASSPTSAGPGDTFPVTGTGAAPLTVVFVPSSSPTAPYLAVTTSGTSVVMPSTLPVPSGSVYNWTPVTNPGETLAQAATNGGVTAYFRLMAAQIFDQPFDGGFALGSGSSTSFTVP